MTDLVLAAVQALQNGGSPARDEYDALRSYLLRQQRRLAGPSRVSEVDDTVDEAMARFLRAQSKVSPLKPEEALAYLNRIARNVYFDRYRRSNRESAAAQPIEELVERHQASIGSSFDDVEILALLDRTATLQTLSAALRALREHDDRVALLVVARWLDIAAAEGASPSARRVAEDMGIAHTTVTRALTRVRELIAQVT